MGKTNKLNLNQQQILLLREFISSFNTRPTFEQYDAFQSRMQKLTPKSKPRSKSIPNTRVGFESQDVVLLPGFNASKDLPLGWAVVAWYDSGGNHTLAGAGEHLLRRIWNSWTPGGPYGFPGDQEDYRQLLAGGLKG